MKILLPNPHPIHVVVLAAGKGSRLGALSDDRPKWLLPVGGRPIADRHLEGIRAAGDAVASVRVLTGHAADAIAAALRERGDDDVLLQFNPEFAELNNWWSVLRALRELPAEGPVVFINSDLCLDPEHVAAFIEAAAESEEEAFLAVDLERELTDESMKVEQAADGTLTKIGKVGLDEPVGEYIGMLFARGSVLSAFRDRLEQFVGRDECANEWYEGAVGRSAAEGTAWHIWPMPSSAWVEIDDDGDLERAEGLAGVR